MMLHIAFISIGLLSFSCAQEKKKETPPVAKQTQGTEDQKPIEPKPEQNNPIVEAAQQESNDPNFDLATAIKLLGSLTDLLDLESELDLAQLKSLINLSGAVSTLSDDKKLQIREFVTKLKLVPIDQRNDVIRMIEATYTEGWISRMIKRVMDRLQ